MSIQDVVELAVAFVKPGDDPASVSKWRAAMSLFIFVLVLHMLWSCGYGAKMGFPGFATSDQIMSITNTLTEHGKQLNVIGEQALERALIETRQAQCKSSEKTFFTQRIADLEGQYSTTMKHNFSLPDCKDLQ